MFFNSFETLWRILLIGTLTYFSLILILQLTGKGTLSKLNAFDFVITVALGSTVASIIISKEVSFADGITTLLLLTLMQFGITWISVRIPALRQFITSKPSLLYYEGKFLYDSMKRLRITEDEILQVIRKKGIGSLKKVEAVVLETNGELTAITDLGKNQDSTIRNVKR